EVLEVRRDVGFHAGKEMIEDPEHEPVLHLLSLEVQVAGMDFLEVVRFLLRLQRHHRRHTFPRDECGAGHVPSGDGLAPSGKEERAPERTHGPYTDRKSTRLNSSHV